MRAKVLSVTMEMKMEFRGYRNREIPNRRSEA